MLILSIFLVPVFVLILFSIVFIIGVEGTTSPGYDDHGVMPVNQVK